MELHGYITLSEVKAEVDLTRPAHDAALERAIGAASRAIDGATGRRFWRDETATPRTYRPTDPDVAYIADLDPGETVTVKTDDNDDGAFEITWADVDFESQPLNATADGVAVESLRAVGTRQFPTCGRRAQLQVTATWGWPTIPKAIEEACLLVTVRLFMRKDAPFGVVGGTPEMAAVRITRDVDVRSLLDPYTHLVIA